MLTELLARWTKARAPRPLASCAENVAITFRLERNGFAARGTIHEVSGNGMVIACNFTVDPGTVLCGQYRVAEVAFVFRGAVCTVEHHATGSWRWTISYLLNAVETPVQSA